MSLIKANSVQIGQSSTATQNFTLSVPSSPDGTIKLARGNSGATTADIFSVSGSGAITGATISGATINSSTVNGGSITLGTSQNTTSGTAIDFTGIPSWVKKISVIFNGVSSNGTGNYLVQIGSGSISSSGYVSTSNETNQASSTGGSSSTSGFILRAGSAAHVVSGITNISIISGNTWISSHVIKLNTTNACFGAGDCTLSGVLDRIRITTTTGTDTFDAGSVNIMYEG